MAGILGHLYRIDRRIEIPTTRVNLGGRVASSPYGAVLNANDLIKSRYISL